MINRDISERRTIPTTVIMVGLVLFFIGCRAGWGPMEKAEVPKEERFASAERYRQEGDLDRALRAYKAYLAEVPEGKEVAAVRHRIGEIYLAQGKYEECLRVLKDVIHRYSDYENMPVVRCRLVECLTRLGLYESSRDEALRWLEDYPCSELRGRVQLILGRDFKAMGMYSKAFSWWLKARETYGKASEAGKVLSRELTALIKTGGVEQLDLMAESAAGTEYAPRINYRRASIYLNRGELEKAHAAAKGLLYSSFDKQWVSKGRDLLRDINAGQGIRKEAVGCLLPLSGRFDLYGREVVKGIRMGMKETAKQRQEVYLDLVFRDTRGDPERAKALLKELVVKENVIAVIGPLSSKSAPRVAKRAQELGVPLITLTQKEKITEQGNMVFRNFLTPSREVEALLDAAMEKLDIRRFAILYPENSYGRYFMNRFWDGLEKRGGVVTGVESYGPDETDFAESIKKMTGLYYPRPKSVTERLEQEQGEEKEAEEGEGSPEEEEEPPPIIDFDAVFVPDNATKVAMIAPQLVYHDVVDVLLMGTSLWQSSELLETAGDYIQGAIFPSGFFVYSDSRVVEHFERNYEARFGKKPGILAAHGYDTIRFLRKVISAHGILTRKELQEALIENPGFEGVTGRMAFDSRGEVVKEALLLTVSGSKMTALTP